MGTSEEARKSRTILVIVLAALGGCTLACCGVGAILLPPAIQQAREAKRRQQAAENLRQIGIALQNYHDNHTVQTASPLLVEIPADESTPLPDRVNAVKKKVVARIEEHGLSRIAAEIQENIQVSIRMTTERAEDGQMAVGVSKIGGTPDLPEGMEWPLCNGKPMSFIAQILLADAAAFDTSESLPKTGTLYFFYDAEQSTWGYDPKDRESWKVVYIEGDVAQLRRAEPPQAVPEQGKFSACSVSFTNELSLPPWESICVEKLRLNDQESEDYSDLRYGTAADEVISKMLGHPDPIQNDMQLECQLVFHRLYTGNASGHEDPRRAELEKGAEDWQLLLQIDSDDNAGMMWGDAGRLYFWIRKQDLEKRAFENVWMILQCY